MTKQYNLPDFTSPQPGGTFLKDNLEPWRDALHSYHKGPTRPSYVVDGMLWIDDSTTPWVAKVFQGSDDIVMGTLDPVELKFTPSGVTAPQASEVEVNDSGFSVLEGENVQDVLTSADVVLDGLGTASAADLIDDDTFATATSTNVPSAESVKAYVDSRGAYLNQQVFTSSGTWTKPAGLTGTEKVLIEVWGAGGGGGSGMTGQNHGAGGGGGGGYNRLQTTVAALSSTVSVTIGAGGKGATSGPASGAAGGDTKFGSLLTGYGGGAGFAANVVASSITGGGGGGNQAKGGNGASGTPGAGGATTGGTGGIGSTVAAPGGGKNGSDGLLGLGGGGGGGSCNASNAFGGNGGNSIWGGGGGGGSAGGAGTLTQGLGGFSMYGGAGGAAAGTGGSAGDGSYPGGGGGGANNNGVGGDGAKGKCVVTIYSS